MNSEPTEKKELNEGQKNASKLSKKTLRTILLLFFCAVFVFSAIMLVSILSSYSAGSEEYKKISDSAVMQDASPVLNEVDEWEYLILDFDYLKSTNKDFRCWMEIPDTNVSYPTVKCKNNSYYLNHTFSKTSNAAGTLFFDYRCNGKLDGTAHNIIYGHRMRDGSMFGRLDKYSDKSYCEAHRVMYIYTADGMYVYEIYAAYVASVFDFTFTFDINSGDEARDYFSSAKAASPWKSKADYEDGGNLLTLSTCVVGDDNKRFVLQAVSRGFVPYPDYLYAED